MIMGGYKMMKKLFITLLVLLISIVAVNAATPSPNYDVSKIEVNDEDLTSTVLDVERGETINIEVTVLGINNVDDVRVSAEIQGYEFGDIRDVSDIFSVEAGVTHKKVLRLTIPEDLDASQTYSLRIEAQDDKDSEVKEVTLNIDEPRHNLGFNPLDGGILVNPSVVTAGRPVFVTARIENLGEKKEEDILVRVSIPALGVSTESFLDELVTELQEQGQRFDDNEESSQSVDLLLRVPEDAPSGEYDLKVDVIYSRGHSQVSQTKKIVVKGVEKSQGENTIINVDGTSKVVGSTTEVPFRLMIANLGSERATYTVSAEGAGLWGESRVEPSFFNVEAGKTGEAAVYVKAKKDAESGNYNFVIRVNRGTELVRELSMSARVEDTGAGASALRTTLTAIFVVLLVAIVALVIWLAVKRSKETGTGAEEPGNVTTGQTYYYHPKQ